MNFRVDPETEAKVQAAIDQYFSQPNVLPSPWSLETNHRRKIFSPAVTDSINRKNLILMKKVPMAHSEAVRSARTVACQTALTIPFDIDLTKLLGDKFRYNEDSEGDVNEPSEREGRKSDDVNVSLGSLRRKLFSANCEHDSFNNDAEAEGKLKEMQSAADNLEGQTSLSQVTPSKDFSGDSDTLFDDTVSQASVHLDNISSSPVTMGMFSGIDFSMRLGRTSTSPTECKNDLISPEISPIRSLNGHHNSIKTSLTFGSCEDANFSFACSNDIVIRESPRSYVNLLTTGRFEGSNAEVSVGGNVDMRDCSTFQPSQ